MKKKLVYNVALTLGLSMLFAQIQAEELVIYSSRNEQLIKPIFDAYTDETGVEIKLLTDNDGAIIQKLRTEGSRTSADILMTVDAGNLWHATELGLLQPVESDVLNDRIPSHLRDPQNNWYGLSVRARTIIYNTNEINPEDLSTYEDLTGEKWKGRFCLRTSKKVYNQSLVAAMIAHQGEEKTEEIVRGWVNNLATDVFSSDTTLIKSIAANECQVGLANTYYLARLLAEDSDFPVSVFWANQNDRGTHVNISGAGVSRYSENIDAAVQLLEWLADAKAQKMYANVNYEYPANPDIDPHEILASWGEFKQDQLNVSKMGELQVDAVKLMDRANYK